MVPLVLRINIFIVNIDTNSSAKVNFDSNIFSDKKKDKKPTFKNARLCMKILS